MMANLPLDFISPYPVNACLSRLRERIKVMRKSSRLVRNVPVRMEVFPLPNGTYQFEIQRNVWSNRDPIYVEVVGFLKEKDNQTIVVGRAGFPLFARIMALIFLGAGLYVSYRTFHLDPVIGVGVSIFVEYFVGKLVQNDLLQMVEKALRYKDY
jgi:hypothetical protein